MNKEENDTITFDPGLIGREDELDVLKDCFDDSLEGRGSTVFISGEAGIGKTKLVGELLKSVEEEGGMLFQGKCLSSDIEPLLPIKDALRDSQLHHIITKNPPPRVLSAYLMIQGGLVVTKAEREEKIDADIFAGMLQGVGNFIKDSLSLMDEDGIGGLNSISYGKYNIVLQMMDNLTLAAVIEGEKSEILIKDMKSTLDGIELESWSGDREDVIHLVPKVEWFVRSGKYDGVDVVDDPKIKQENLFENVLLGIQRISEESPVVLFIDDLQWADPTTLHLLHYLSRNTRDDRVFIVCTYRTEDILEKTDVSQGVHPLKTTIQDMSREGLFQEIDLERLDDSSVKDFIRRALERSELTENFFYEVYKESEGNPFFLLEIIRMLVEEGHLKKEGGIWIAVGEVDEINIPSKVYDVVVRRLDRLLEDQRDMLECASVVGEEFESDIVGEVTGLSRMDLLKNLDKIERTHNLIHSIERRYKFDHGKIREVLYNGMNEVLREEYHRIVAESYKNLFGDRGEEMINKIGHHFFMAGDPEGGRYLSMAGDIAKEEYSNEEAVDFYEKALGSLEGGKRKEVYKKLGDVYSLVSNYEKAGENYKKALEMEDVDSEKAAIYVELGNLYIKINDHEKSLDYTERGLALVDKKSKVGCRLLGNLGLNKMSGGDFVEAKGVFEEELKTAGEIDHTAEIAQAYLNLGTVEWRTEEFDEAIRLHHKAEELYQKVDDVIGYTTTINNLGIIYDLVGELEKALEFLEKSLEINKKMGYKFGVARVLDNMGMVNYDIGRLDESVRCHRESLEIRKKIGHLRGIPTSMNNLGDAYRRKGELDRCLELQKESLRLYEEIGESSAVAMVMNNIAEVYYDMGESGEARRYHEKSMALCNELGEKHTPLYDYCGMVNVSLGDGLVSDALDYAERAIETAGELNAVREGAIARRLLGRAYRMNDDLEKGLRELDKAADIINKINAREQLPDLYYEYGKMWEGMGDMEKSEMYLKKALELGGEMGMKLLVGKVEGALKELA